MGKKMMLEKDFEAFFMSESKVYDGDTLSDVFIKVRTLSKDFGSEDLFPGLSIRDDDLYVVSDIRVRGIDTPERRPRRRGRTSESLLREKAAAEEARLLVMDLLSENDYCLILRNPELGKYAGRIIGDVVIRDVDLGEYLISKGYAYEYYGGKRLKFDDWYKVELVEDD